MLYIIKSSITIEFLSIDVVVNLVEIVVILVVVVLIMYVCHAYRHINVYLFLI